MATPVPGEKISDATDVLIHALHLDQLISIVDIGANPIGGPPPYESLLSRGVGRLTGFEPQADAFAKLMAVARPNET